MEEAVQINAQALAKHRQELAKLDVQPRDPLIQAPKGPGPSNQEMWKIRKEAVVQLKKRKLADAENSVSTLNISDIRSTNLALAGVLHILCPAPAGLCARDRQGLCQLQHQKGPVLFPGSKKFGQDHYLIRRRVHNTEGETS
jgi:hypothetical protein